MKSDLSLRNKQCHCRRTSKETETDYSIFRTQVPHRYFPYILLQKMSPDTRLPSVFWKWFKEHDAASWHTGWRLDDGMTINHDGGWRCVPSMYTPSHYIMTVNDDVYGKCIRYLTLSWNATLNHDWMTVMIICIRSMYTVPHYIMTMCTINVYGTSLYHDDVYGQCIRYHTKSWRYVRSMYTVPH